MKHVIDDQELFLKQVVPSPPPTESFSELPPLINDGDTIVVRGFEQPLSKGILNLYFTNEVISGGGPINRIVTKEKEAFIVFTDQSSRLSLIN